jgi:sulfite oxidase
VTPAELFYVRNHGTVPDIDGAAYRLSIEGEVEAPGLLSIDDLRRSFEKISLMAVLQCAGNRRCDMSAIAPIPGEVEWGAQAIGNAVWAGVRLRDVLMSVRPRKGARHIAFMGADEIDKAGKRIGFGASVSVEKAMRPETILAYEMNGVPLEAIHGFPLRAVVPGYVGARSVKWLTTITAQHDASDNFYQAKSYKTFPPDVTSKDAVWEKGTTLEDVAINSVVCRPTAGERVTAGSVRISGYAVGAGGSAIARVEASGDGGASWILADLVGKSEPWRWNLWQARVELGVGTHELVVRARDVDGNTQPEKGDSIWNFKGYMWNAWHRVRVVATP